MSSLYTEILIAFMKYLEPDGAELLEDDIRYFAAEGNLSELAKHLYDAVLTPSKLINLFIL